MKKIKEKMIERIIQYTPCGTEDYELEAFEQYVSDLYEFVGDILDKTDNRYEKALKAIDRNEDEIYIYYAYAELRYYYFDRETLDLLQVEIAEPGYFKLEGSNAYVMDNIWEDFQAQYIDTEFILIDNKKMEHKIVMSGSITEAIQEYSRDLEEDIYIDDVKVNILNDVEIPF